MTHTSAQRIRIRFILQFKPERISTCFSVYAVCMRRLRLTEEEAADIVSQIDGLEGLHEYGVGEDTLRELLRNLHQEKAQRRTVTVSEATLATLADAAVRLAETGGDEDPSPIWKAVAQAKDVLKK